MKKDIIKRWGRNSVNLAKRNSPVDKGLLVSTISRQNRKKGFTISWNVKYTKFPNYGTDPFINAGLFAGTLNPGQQAQYFVESTVVDIVDMIQNGGNTLKYGGRPTKRTHNLRKQKNINNLKNFRKLMIRRR